MTKVYESLIHCDKCGNWKWWFKKNHLGEEFPVCSECYPPQDIIELQPMSYKLMEIGQRIGILAVGRRLTEEDKRIYTARKYGGVEK